MAQPSAPPSYDEAISKQPPNNQPPYPSGGYQPVATMPEPMVYNAPSYQSSPPAPQPSSGNDFEGFTTSAGFDDKSVRRLFVRKVYITLAVQLLVTFGIVCIFTFIPAVKEVIRANSALYYVAYAIFLVLYITLVCCTNIRRKSPQNIILLMIFTLAFSYMVGTIASFYNTMSVVIALGITVGVCVAVTLFSMQTKFDFTKCSGLLFVLMLVLMLFGFITIFTFSYNWVVYGALGALVFTLFLAFDTQMIMGGKRYELDPEEYIYGALNLYIDIVYIFIFLLSLFGDH